MAELPWFRLYTDAVDNVKLRMLAFEDRWHYVAICCLKRSGLLDKHDQQNYTRMIAIKLGLQLSDLDEVKRRLMEVDLIDESFSPIGWSDRQFESDSSTERVRQYRARRNVTETKRPCNGTVTVQDTDTDTDTDKTLGRNSDEFDRFWNLYDKKNKKKPAVSAFGRLTSTDRHSLMAHLPERVKDPQFKNYQPDAVTFLNQRRWEDEHWKTEAKAQSLKELSDNQLLKLAQNKNIGTAGLSRQQLIDKVERHRG